MPQRLSRLSNAMLIEPLVVVAGTAVMIVALILAAAFFSLNDRLETENKSLRRLLAEQKEGSKRK